MLLALLELTEACKEHRRLTSLLSKNVNWLMKQPRPNPRLKLVSLRIFTRMAFVQDLTSKINKQYSFLEYEMFEADDNRFLSFLDDLMERSAVFARKKNRLRRALIVLLVEQYGDEIKVLESEWVFHCPYSELA